jgi:hypothetical protein
MARVRRIQQEGPMTINPFAWFRLLESIDRRLAHLQTNVTNLSTLTIMVLNKENAMSATLAQFEEKFQQILGTNATIGDLVVALGNDIQNVRGDIQKLQDQIATGTPGLSEADAQSALASLDSIAATLGLSASKLADAGQALKDAAAIVPDDAPTTEPV